METDKPLSVLLKFYPPTFFPQEYVFSALLDETAKVLHKITQWPSECTLSLRSDTILRLAMYTVDHDDATPGGTFFSQVYIPMERVIENGTSLSFCTLWLGCLEQNEHEFPAVEDVSKVNTCFSESLLKGQDLLAPKVGVSVKIYDESDNDRLAMFGIVDMYEYAIAQLYGKVERAMTEKMLQMDKLDASVSERNTQINDIMEKHSEQLSGNETELTLLRTEKVDDITRLQEQMDEKDLKLEALSAEVHTLKLARRDTVRKLEKIKSGEEPLLVLESREDPTDIAKRAQQVAEKERQKTRGLEKELKKLKQRFRELEEETEAAQAPLMQPILTSTRFQEEEVRKLQREVAQLSKGKIDAQRKKKQAETNMEQMKAKLTDMTQLLDRQKAEAQRDVEMKTQRFFLNVRSIREEAKKYKEEVQLHQQSGLSLQKELDTRKLENAQLEAAMDALQKRNALLEHLVPEIQAKLQPEATGESCGPMPVPAHEAEAVAEAICAPSVEAVEATETARLALDTAEVCVASAEMGNGEASRPPSVAIAASFPYRPRLSVAREIRAQSCPRARNVQSNGAENVNHALNNGHAGKIVLKIKPKAKSDKAHWQSIKSTRNDKDKNAVAKENKTFSNPGSLPARRPPVPTRESLASAATALSKKHSARRSVPPRDSSEQQKRVPPSTCSFATSSGWLSSPDTIRDPNESLDIARKRSLVDLNDVPQARNSSAPTTPLHPQPGLANGNVTHNAHHPAAVAREALDNSVAVEGGVQLERSATPDSQGIDASVLFEHAGLAVDKPDCVWPPCDALERRSSDGETKPSAQCAVFEDMLASPVEVHRSVAQNPQTSSLEENHRLPTQHSRSSVQDSRIPPMQESKSPIVQDVRVIDQRSPTRSLVRLDSLADDEGKISTVTQHHKLNAVPFQDPKHPLHNPFGVLWNSPHFGKLDTQPSAVETANQTAECAETAPWRPADARTSQAYANQAQQRSPAYPSQAYVGLPQPSPSYVADASIPPGTWATRPGTHVVQMLQRKSLPGVAAPPARPVLKPSSRATIGHGDLFSRFSAWGYGISGDAADQRIQYIPRQQGANPRAQFAVASSTK
eukprot:GEMP01002928.1.p1 GENE.GEMP01002928.1~~GEMP01002928.1.p1  ORF type:complete len:1090 (-),score=267.27 GEMP01002928.1:812-4081(-)